MHILVERRTVQLSNLIGNTYMKVTCEVKLSQNMITKLYDDDANSILR